MAYNHEAVIEKKARHSVKMFDGSKAGHAGVVDEFAGIIAAGRERYLNNTWFPPARVLETDLGEWRYRDDDHQAHGPAAPEQGPPGTQRSGTPVREAIWLIIVGFAAPE